MKFIKLKIYDSNALSEEVNLICQLHKQLIEEVDRTNDPSSIQELENLQENIAERINEISAFNERFSFDSRVSVFVKLNKTLSRIIGNYKVKINENKKKRSVSQNNNVSSDLREKTKENDKTRTNISVTVNQTNENKKKPTTNFRNSSQENSHNNYYNKPEPSVFSNKTNPKGGDKLELGQKDNKTELASNTTGTYNKDMAEFAQWREIVFKIKLSPEEFQLLVNEKQNKRNFTNMNQTQQSVGNMSKK